jgi:Transposase DDE domain group 1
VAGVVKNNATKSHKAGAHQTVTPAFQLSTGAKTIHIQTTEQQLSAHAGQVSFWGFMHLRKVRALLARALPHRPTSPNALPPAEIALGLIAGIVAGADKLARVAWLRGDPLLPEVLAVRRLPSQSTLSRFLAVFGAASNLVCFRQLWRWTMERLPSRKEGYTMDFDTTGLLHEDGHQEGVRVGHTRVGLKPCLQPMLAVLAEAKLCAQFWLRAGHAHCSNNLLAFTQELLANLPRHLRLRLIRADSGFYYDPWLRLLESRRLHYIVVADLSVRVKSLLRKTTQWQATSVAGLEVAEVAYESKYASEVRRLILIRRQVAVESRGGGKQLFDLPGYKFQVLVTNLPPSVSPLQVWFDYNGRAGIENVIKELREGFGLASFCCQKFFASEAVLALAVFGYNLITLFARHLGWLEKMTITTLRYRLFHCAGLITHGQGRTTIKLAIPKSHRRWWSALWEKLLSPFPNCNAVEQHP